MKSLRKRTAELLEAHYGAGGWGHVVDIFLVTLILTNVILIILETVPSLSSQYKVAFTYIEIFSIVIFTIEYLLRLWSCVEDEVDVQSSKKWSRLRWMFSPLGLIDLLAILPFYIFLFIPDSELSLLMLRLFRGLRLLRIFKLTRYSSALNILFSVLRREVRVLAVTSFILSMVMVMASWGMYLLERDVQPEVFGSIPAAMWWAVVTLTTVGYGDVIPVTGGGNFRVFRQQSQPGPIVFLGTRIKFIFKVKALSAFRPPDRMQQGNPFQMLRQVHSHRFEYGRCDIQQGSVHIG